MDDYNTEFDLTHIYEKAKYIHERSKQGGNYIDINLAMYKQLYDYSEKAKKKKDEALEIIMEAIKTNTVILHTRSNNRYVRELSSDYLEGGEDDE